MKKHDEGYALALVLVVLTVICIVALSMMSVSLSNVTRQQVNLKHMEEKYAAQGEIEKVVARLEKELLSSETPGIINVKGIDIEYWCTEQRVEYGNDLELIKDIDNDGVNDAGKERLTFTLTTKMPDSSVQIQCTIRITGAKIEEKTQGANIYYAVTAPAIEYDSYTILYNSNPAPEGGDGA